MEIIRNNQEYELTCEELRLAYEAYKRECYGEDVMGKFEQMISDNELVLSETDYENMSEAEMKIFEETACNLLEELLAHNDGYYEAFWESVRNALKETAGLHSEESMTFALLKKIFCLHEELTKKLIPEYRRPLSAEITFTDRSKKKDVSPELRTYIIFSYSPMFIPNSESKALFGICKNKPEPSVRLDTVMKDTGVENGWEVEKIKLIREEETAL